MAELFDKYYCTNCQDEIPGIRVHCVECSDFDLCLSCFSAGAEIGSHRNDHSYQLMDTSILSIFRGKGSWSAREELHLLDAIEQYGFGNWEIISKHIETRTPDEAREEYVSKFLSGSIGRHTWVPAAEAHRPHLLDHTVSTDSGPLGSNVVQKLPPLDVAPEESAQLGYMPNRDDFEREYDPSAEQLVSTLTLNTDDEDTDLILKLAQVDIYTRRLRERARRKRLVRDYQLISNFFRGTQKRSRHSRDQREFRDRFRVFAQFYTSHEYERLLASLEREKELRIRLSELNRYRWNGLTRMEECIHFEQHAAAAQHKSTGPFGHGRTDNPPTGNRPGSYSHSPHSRRGEAGNAERGSSSIVQRLTHHTGDQTCSDGSLPSRNSLDSCRGLSGPSSQQQPTTTTTPTSTTVNSYQVHHQQQPQHQQQNGNTAAGNGRPIQQQQQQQQQQEVPNSGLTGSGQHLQSHQVSLPQQQQQHQQQQLLHPPPPQQHIIQQQQQQPLVHYQPGENLLSSNEIQLCTSLNMPPTRYISLKTVLLSGTPITGTASYTENLIRKYLIKAGWLSH